MDKKIIELAEGTERIEIYEFGSVDDKGPDYLNNEQDLLIENLPDAPERTTVELTKDELEDIKEAYKTSKENGEKSVFGFLLTASDMAIRTDFDLLAKWFLGYVDLIPKPMFLVEVDMHDTLGNLQLAHVWKNEKHGAVTPYLDTDMPMIAYNYEEFSEEEADEIIEGLHALKARKVTLYKD